MDHNAFRPKKSGKKPEVAPPPAPPPEVRNNGENGHYYHHHLHHHNPGAGHYRDDGYLDPMDHLSSIRRLNSIDISHARNVKMNFRDFTEADAEFYATRGPASPYGYPDQYAIEHRHGGPVGLPPPPRPMYMMPPPPPPPQQLIRFGPRPPRYQPFHFYGGEDPNNCNTM